MLALARIAGETAPLLFTAFNNRFFTTSLTQPIASLTVQVYTYAISPYEDWHRQAWAGALVLVTIVLALLAAGAVRHAPPRAFIAIFDDRHRDRAGAWPNIHTGATHALTNEPGAQRTEEVHEESHIGRPTTALDVVLPEEIELPR